MSSNQSNTNQSNESANNTNQSNENANNSNPSNENANNTNPSNDNTNNNPSNDNTNNNLSQQPSQNIVTSNVNQSNNNTSNNNTSNGIQNNNNSSNDIQNNNNQSNDNQSLINHIFIVNSSNRLNSENGSSNHMSRNIENINQPQNIGSIINNNPNVNHQNISVNNQNVDNSTKSIHNTDVTSNISKTDIISDPINKPNEVINLNSYSKGLIYFIRNYKDDSHTFNDHEEEIQIFSHEKVEIVTESEKTYRKYVISNLLRAIHPKYDTKKQNYNFEIFYGDSVTQSEREINLYTLHSYYTHIKKNPSETHVFAIYKVKMVRNDGVENFLSQDKEKHDEPTLGKDEIISFYEKEECNTYETHVFLGDILDELLFHEAAIEQYLKAKELEPNNPKIYNYIGFVYHFNLKQYETSIPYFQEATRLDPQNFRAFNNLGCAYLLSGNIEKALENFYKSVEISPGNPRAQYNLGETLDKHYQKYDEALVHYEEAIKRFKEEGIANHQSYGNAYKNAAKIYEKKAKEYYDLGEKCTITANK